MSTLKVDAIRHNSATSDAITTAADGTCTAKLTSIGGGGLSHRNIIVNGDMRIAQRGVSSTAQGYETVDRFKSIQSSIDEVASQAQVDVASGTTPYTLGLRKAFKFTNGNQTSGANADDLVKMMHRMEAQDIANSGWNYLSSSSYLTMSFWVKSSVAQNFYVTLIAYDSSTYSYTFETGALSADTWTKVTHSIPGNSNLTFDNDSGLGLEINWYQYAGTNYTDGSHSLNTWGAYSGSNLMPDMTSTWYTTNDATFELTGVQLEVGDTATTFEHKRFADQLRDCQRYFQKSYNYDDAVGSSGVQGWFQWRRDGGNRPHIPLLTSMRSTPTFQGYNYVGGTAGQFRNASNGTNHAIGSVNVIGQNIVSFDAGATGWNQIGTGEVGFMYYSLESEL